MLEAGTITKKKETKIVILGGYNSGKTTTLDRLCEKKALVEYNGTTVSMDYGNTHINGDKVHIFASPGQERFRFMRDVLSHRLDGAILVVDTEKGVTPMDQEIMDHLHQGSVPYVIFANKQDLNPNVLELNVEAPIIPTSAIDGYGLQEGLQRLLELVSNSSK